MEVTFYTYFGIVAFWYLFIFRLLPWIEGDHK